MLYELRHRLAIGKGDALCGAVSRQEVSLKLYVGFSSAFVRNCVKVKIVLMQRRRLRSNCDWKSRDAVTSWPLHLKSKRFIPTFKSLTRRFVRSRSETCAEKSSRSADPRLDERSRLESPELCDCFSNCAKRSSERSKLEPLIREVSENRLCLTSSIQTIEAITGVRTCREAI